MTHFYVILEIKFHKIFCQIQPLKNQCLSKKNSLTDCFKTLKRWKFLLRMVSVQIFLNFDKSKLQCFVLIPFSAKLFPWQYFWGSIDIFLPRLLEKFAFKISEQSYYDWRQRVESSASEKCCKIRNPNSGTKIVKIPQ